MDRYIIPVTWTANGVPSALISRDLFSDPAYSAFVLTSLAKCRTDASLCGTHQLYQAISGNTDSPNFPKNATSISPYLLLRLQFVSGSSVS